MSLAQAGHEGLQSADEGRWSAVLHREFANLRAAHGFAIMSEDVGLALGLVAALKWYGGLRLVGEVYDSWAAGAAGLPGVADHPQYPVVLGIAAMGAWAGGELSKARSLADRALASAPNPDDPRRINALGAVLMVNMFEGRLDESWPLIEDVIRLARACGDHPSEVQWLLNRALLAGYSGDVDRALGFVAEARGSLVEAPSWRAFEHYVTGEAILDADPERAIMELDEAHRIASTSGNDFVAAVSRLSAVSLRGRHFDPQGALHGYAEVIDQWRRAATGSSSGRRSATSSNCSRGSVWTRRPQCSSRRPTPRRPLLPRMARTERASTPSRPHCPRAWTHRRSNARAGAVSA